MANTTANVVVAGTGTLYAAATGVSAPTDVSSAGTAWTEVGYISANGVTLGYAREENPVKVWQSLDALRYITTGRTVTVKAELMEWSPANVVLGLGGGSASAGTAVGTYTYPTASENNSKAIMFDIVDASYTFRFFFPSMRQTGDIDAALGREDAAMLALEFSNTATSTQPTIISNHPAWHS